MILLLQGDREIMNKSDEIVDNLELEKLIVINKECFLRQAKLKCMLCAVVLP